MSDKSAETVRCAPLCGAAKAYGRFDQPWKHEAACPVRQEWESTRAGTALPKVGVAGQEKQ